MGSSLRSSAKDFRMAWGELFLYAWSCLYGYWLIAAPARCWPVVSHAQRKHDRRKTPTLPFMRSLLINLLLRRAAASFNQRIEPMTRSASTLCVKSEAAGALPVMAHPGR